MAMNRQRRTANISNIFSYDDAGNIVIKDYGQVTRYSWNGLIHGFIGQVSISSVAAATTDTDRFLVSDGGVLKYRTGVELLSDIGGVPSTRTLTINGVTQDLSADRTFTIAAGISGSGADGQVAYWNGTNSQTGSNNFLWDNANQRLSITGQSAISTTTLSAICANGTLSLNNASQHYVDVTLSTTSNQGSVSNLWRNNSSLSGALVMYSSAEGNNLFGTSRNSAFALLNNSGTKFYIGTINSTDLIFGTTNLERMRLFAGGNFALGGSVDGGQRLQVYGDAFIKGSGNTSATNALTIQNSASGALFSVRNDGLTTINGNTTFLGTIAGSNAARFVIVGGNFAVNITSNNPNNGEGSLITTGAITTTDSQTKNVINVNNAVTSTSASFNTLNGFAFTSTINQTLGIIRGLYVNPTLTASTDFRAIEWSNNSGWGLYGAGTAPNLLSGVTIIRTNASSNEVPLLVQNYGTLSGFKTVSIDLVAVNGDARITAGNQVFANGGSGFLSFSTRTAEALTEKVRIDSAGRLLVGTTSSTFLLDVNGTARVSGNTTISLNQNAVTELLISNTTPGTGANSSVRLLSDVSAGSCIIAKNSNTFTPYKISSPRDFVLYNSTTGGDISILNDFATGKINFASGGSSTAQMTLTAAGRLLLGTTTEGTFLLDVNGTARVSSSLDIGNNSDQSTYIAFRSPSSKLSWWGSMGAAGQFINNSAIGDLFIRPNAPSSTTYFFKSIANLGEAGYRYQFTTGQAIYKDNGTTFTSYASSIFALDSVSRGFLPPRMTTTQKNAIATPAAGLQVYDSTTNAPNYYDGTAWVAMAGGSGSGTYTPTVTVISGGATSVTTNVARYIRVGNVVTVYGVFFYQPSGSGAVETNNQFSITLPITRTVTTNFASGTVSFSTVSGVGNQAQGYLYSTATTTIDLYAQNWWSGSGANAYYVFSYEIN